MCNDTGFLVEGLPTYPEKKNGCDWEVEYKAKCEEYERLLYDYNKHTSDLRDLYERYHICKDENAYLKARNEKLEAIVRAVETLCGGKILDD